MVKNLLNLFFPKVCLACNYSLGDNEKYICTDCRHQLPVTNFHFDKKETAKNILYGRVDLENATALLHFSKNGHVQELIHKLKYKGHEEIGSVLGKWLGVELSQLEDYRSIDVVVPVPLHKTRLIKRGYNQVSKFGKELAKALDAEFNKDILIRRYASKTQVFKNRLGRSDNRGLIFTLRSSDNLKGKHLLLVDDIITTGATVEACAKELLSIRDVKLSLATMAITD